MPRITRTKTSTTVRRQQFSTPVDLAFVVSTLLEMDPTKLQLLLEPTAGHGMLLLQRTRRASSPTRSTPTATSP